MSVIGAAKRYKAGIERMPVHDAARNVVGFFLCLFFSVAFVVILAGSIFSAITYKTEPAVVTACAGQETRGAHCTVLFRLDGSDHEAQVDTQETQPEPGDRISIRVNSDGEDANIAGRAEVLNILWLLGATVFALGFTWANAAALQKASRSTAEAPPVDKNRSTAPETVLVRESAEDDREHQG